MALGRRLVRDRVASSCERPPVLLTARRSLHVRTRRGMSAVVSAADVLTSDLTLQMPKLTVDRELPRTESWLHKPDDGSFTINGSFINASTLYAKFTELPHSRISY